MIQKSQQLCNISLLLMSLLLLPHRNAAATAAGPTASNANETLTEASAAAKSAEAASTSKATQLKTSAANVASKYEIRGVAGEPNYKSVNLTWEVEFVPAPAPATKRERGSVGGDGGDGDTDVNMSVDVEPPKAFQIFYCEMQNYGPQRCRVKLVNGTLANFEEKSAQVQHFGALVDNLRMATKYSFHIRPATQRRASMRISSGRAELFNENEIESELSRGHLAGQSIVIPTKGFSAQATQCLPQASEIEVETGPYFGGRIVVDGGNCGIKGNAADAADKYTMRIDHKQCGSMVKPETNTVETFITVQENLGIFTHSTRRFVVVCSYQSGMQTVRASFTVPGKNGVAAAYEPNDPFEPDELRLGREMRHMRYVNKSELVLKEEDSDSAIDSFEAVVVETQAPEQQPPAEKSNATRQDQGRALSLDSLSAVNNLAEEAPAPRQTLAHLDTKYAKLVVDQPAHSLNSWTAAQAVKLKQTHVDLDEDADDDEAYAATLHYVTANLGSVLVTVSISVIIISICIIVVHRLAAAQRQRLRLRLKSNMALPRPSPSPSTHQPHKTLPRALQQQYQCTL